MTQLALIRCFMVPTGTYHQQVRRAYTTEALSGQAIARLAEETARGANLTTGAVARAVGGILAPSAVPDSHISIHNGWSTTRFRFLLEFEMRLPGLNASFRKIITGFTDHDDYSRGYGNTVHIDPHSLMTVDNHITLKDMRVGGYLRSTVVSNDLVLVGDHSPSYNRSNEYSLRPTDVLGSVSSAGTVLGFQEQGQPEIIDTRMQFGAGIKNSRRSNNIASNYLSRLLTGYREAAAMSQDEDNMQQVYAVGSAHLSETSVSDDQFFYSLMQDTEFLRTGYFTYGQLAYIFPDLDAKTQIGKPVQFTGGLMPTNAMETEHWQGSNMETVYANIIATGIPAIMTECMMAYFAFTITNMTPNRYVDVFANQEPGMLVEGVDANPYMDKFRAEVINSIIPLIDPNNVVDYCITVECDVYSNLSVTVSIENGYPVVFSAPLFASSKLSPIVTGDAGRVTRLTEDISTVLAIIDGGSSQPIVTSVSQWGAQPNSSPQIITSVGASNGTSRFL